VVEAGALVAAEPLLLQRLPQLGLPQHPRVVPVVRDELVVQAEREVRDAQVVHLSLRLTQPRLRNNRLLGQRRTISPRTVCLPACPESWASRILWNS